MEGAEQGSTKDLSVVWNRLPLELQHEVWALLPPCDAVMLSLVCHQWREASQTESLWRTIHHRFTFRSLLNGEERIGTKHH